MRPWIQGMLSLLLAGWLSLWLCAPDVRDVLEDPEAGDTEPSQDTEESDSDLALLPALVAPTHRTGEIAYAGRPLSARGTQHDRTVRHRDPRHEPDRPPERAHHA